jgi:uracil-DNA glycosylase
MMPVSSDGPPSPALSAAAVRRDSGHSQTLAALAERIVECRACPRLVTWREQVASEKRRAFADQDYWGRPVPGFGDVNPSVLIVGLAPAAHGANRTGRVFTGDRSGDFLFASLHRVGFASQATSDSRDDGLTLSGARVVAAVRCAPPANAPSPDERDTCAPWLQRELALVRHSLKVVVALGAFGWDAALGALAAAGSDLPRPRPRFAHGAHVILDGDPAREHGTSVHVLGTYHPSQQNTFTGRLTQSMLDDVFRTARLMSGA